MYRKREGLYAAGKVGSASRRRDGLHLYLGAREKRRPPRGATERGKGGGGESPFSLSPRRPTERGSASPSSSKEEKGCTFPTEARRGGKEKEGWLLFSTNGRRRKTQGGGGALVSVRQEGKGMGEHPEERKRGLLFLCIPGEIRANNKGGKRDIFSEGGRQNRRRAADTRGGKEKRKLSHSVSKRGKKVPFGETEAHLFVYFPKEKGSAQCTILRLTGEEGEGRGGRLLLLKGEKNGWEKKGGKRLCAAFFSWKGGKKRMQGGNHNGEEQRENISHPPQKKCTEYILPFLGRKGGIAPTSFSRKMRERKKGGGASWANVVGGGGRV